MKGHLGNHPCPNLGVAIHDIAEDPCCPPRSRGAQGDAATVALSADRGLNQGGADVVEGLTFPEKTRVEPCAEFLVVFPIRSGGLSSSDKVTICEPCVLPQGCARSVEYTLTFDIRRNEFTFNRLAILLKRKRSSDTIRDLLRDGQDRLGDVGEESRSIRILLIGAPEVRQLTVKNARLGLIASAEIKPLTLSKRSARPVIGGDGVSLLDLQRSPTHPMGIDALAPCNALARRAAIFRCFRLASVFLRGFRLCRFLRLLLRLRLLDLLQGFCIVHSDGVLSGRFFFSLESRRLRGTHD